MAEKKTRARAKATFPTVLLTLLSIVQALALELMWSHVTEQTYLYAWSFGAALGWLQISANLLGILLIWLIYSDLVLRLTWVPTTTDAIFPFLVGVLEFAQIEQLGPANLGSWLIILSVLFAAMSWISQVTMRRARGEIDNQEFFAGVNPADWRDFLVLAVPISILLLSGIGFVISGNQGWPAAVALTLVIALLSYQIWMNHIYTQRSYQPDSD